MVSDVIDSRNIESTMEVLEDPTNIPTRRQLSDKINSMFSDLIPGYSPKKEVRLREKKALLILLGFLEDPGDFSSKGIKKPSLSTFYDPSKTFKLSSVEYLKQWDKFPEEWRSESAPKGLYLTMMKFLQRYEIFRLLGPHQQKKLKKLTKESIKNVSDLDYEILFSFLTDPGKFSSRGIDKPTISRYKRPDYFKNQAKNYLSQWQNYPRNLFIHEMQRNIIYAMMEYLDHKAQQQNDKTQKN